MAQRRVGLLPKRVSAFLDSTFPFRHRLWQDIFNTPRCWV
jgi:hypothetical protein